MQFTKASAVDRMHRARAINPEVYDRLMASADVRSFTECWNFQHSKTRDGYGQIRVNGPKHRAHRVMFSLFYPGVAAPVVRHSCNNPSCVNPAHLRPGTQKDNAQDRVASGRGGDLRGGNNGRAVLTEADVQAIRASDESGPALALRYGVTRQTIYAIRTRRLWAHIN